MGLGLISLLFGVGAVSGSALFAWLGPRLPRRQAYAWGFLVGGAPRFLALALASTLPPVLIVMLVAGSRRGCDQPGARRRRVRAGPAAPAGAGARRCQGRSPGSASRSVGCSAGFAVAVLGPDAALVVFGTAYGVATLAPFTLPAWRGLDRAERVPEEVPG